MKIEIPDNATNGEVIKALFPNCLICGETGVSFVSFWYTKEEDGRYVNFREFWWNSPYKENRNETSKEETDQSSKKEQT